MNPEAVRILKAYVAVEGSQPQLELRADCDGIVPIGAGKVIESVECRAAEWQIVHIDTDLGVVAPRTIITEVPIHTHACFLEQIATAGLETTVKRGEVIPGDKFDRGADEISCLKQRPCPCDDAVLRLCLVHQHSRPETRQRR